MRSDTPGHSSTGVSEVVQQAVAQVTGINSDVTMLKLRPPLDHQSNRLYELHLADKHLIVKEFLKPAEWQDAPKREYRALELLSSMDIAPQPIFYDPSIGPVVIYEYLAGTMWNRRTPSPQELRALADLWLRMNRISAPNLWDSRQSSFAEAGAYIQGCFQTYSAWAEDAYPPGVEIAHRCQSILEDNCKTVAELQTHTPVLCFCRADSRFANVIRRPDNRLAMVDWEDSGLRDPARDIADLITHPNQEDLLSWEEWQPFLQRYAQERSKLDPTLMARTHLYLKLFPIFWLALLLERGVTLAQAGKLAESYTNDMPFAHRLRRYLARAQTNSPDEWAAVFAAIRSNPIHFFPHNTSEA